MDAQFTTNELITVEAAEAEIASFKPFIPFRGDRTYAWMQHRMTMHIPGLERATNREELRTRASACLALINYLLTLFNNQ